MKVLALLLVCLQLAHPQPLLGGLERLLTDIGRYPGEREINNLYTAGPRLLQTATTAVDAGAGGVINTVSPVAVTPVVSQPAVVTTVPAVMDPPMMMTSFLPVIFAVAVVKALMLG